MKKILFLLIVLFALVSCEKDPVIDKGKLDPNATILIRAGKGVKTRAAINDLTAHQIVEDALVITFQSHYFDNKYEEVAKVMSRGFNEQQKDFDLPALKMLGIDIISAEGNYWRDFTNAFDVFIVNADRDTIAYVPNQVINDARIAIETAFADENYTEVYELFNTAFTFLPISE